MNSIAHVLNFAFIRFIHKIARDCVLLDVLNWNMLIKQNADVYQIVMVNFANMQITPQINAYFPVLFSLTPSQTTTLTHV